MTASCFEFYSFFLNKSLQIIQQELFIYAPRDPLQNRLEISTITL